MNERGGEAGWMRILKLLGYDGNCLSQCASTQVEDADIGSPSRDGYLMYHEKWSENLHFFAQLYSFES